jgi:hypothetical protein
MDSVILQEEKEFVLLPYDNHETQEDNGSGFHTSLDIEHGTFDLHGKDSDVASNLGNFEYMPSTFLDLSTKEFGMMTQTHDAQGNKLETVSIHPFLKLKQIAMKETEDQNKVSVEDRMQSVRYMCFIPYRDGAIHCREATEAIVFDSSIDIYKRYYFFSNNERYFKLTDDIVHYIHPLFFQRGKSEGYPFELIIRSARYILSFYHVETDTRQSVLDWLLDIADDNTEAHRVRAEVADVLITCGEPDEAEFGLGIIQQIGVKKDFYDSEENIHGSDIGKSAKNILRALQTSISKQDLDSVSCDEIFNYILPYALELEDKQMIESFFLRVQTDPTRFERLTLLDILKLVYIKLKQQPEKYFNTGKVRLYQEISDAVDTCATGYMIRILNVMQGIVEGKEFVLRMSPKDEIRSVVFSKMNLILRSLPSEEQQRILESIEYPDKNGRTDAIEFVRCYDPREELWEEYNMIISEDEFEMIVQECLDQYINV